MKRFSNSLITIIIATILMTIVSLPDSVKSKLPNDPVSTWVKNQKVTLGLDLQGGTQLDYRIDLRNANARNEDDDDSNDISIHDVIEGVRTTIERRVNGLGVSEPQIYLSNIAGEDHIIVELAGIKDIEEAKKVVGKTIQLEFKEPKTEAILMKLIKLKKRQMKFCKKRLHLTLILQKSAKVCRQATTKSNSKPIRKASKSNYLLIIKIFCQPWQMAKFITRRLRAVVSLC